MPSVVVIETVVPCVLTFVVFVCLFHACVSCVFCVFCVSLLQKNKSSSSFLQMVKCLGKSIVLRFKAIVVAGRRLQLELIHRRKYNPVLHRLIVDHVGTYITLDLSSDDGASVMAGTSTKKKPLASLTSFAGQRAGEKGQRVHRVRRVQQANVFVAAVAHGKNQGFNPFVPRTKEVDDNNSKKATSPVLLKIAEMGGLKKLLALVKDQLMSNEETVGGGSGGGSGSGSGSAVSNGGKEGVTSASPLLGKTSSSPTTATEQEDEEESSLSKSEKKNIERKKKEKQQMWKWLSALEGNISLPGFSEAFMSNDICVLLLLKALGVHPEQNNEHHNERRNERHTGTTALEELLDDPLGSQVSALTVLFQQCCSSTTTSTSSSTTSTTTTTTTSSDQENVMYLTCLRSGVLDRLLLRIGELQSEEPRDTGWTSQYEDPIVVSERNKKNALKALAKAQAKAHAKAQANEETNDETNEETIETPEKNKAEPLWTPGYGTGSGSTTSDDKAREATLQKRYTRTVKTLECVASFLEIPPSMAEKDWALYVQIIKASPVLKVFMAYLFGNTASGILSKPDLFIAILRCLSAMSEHEALVPLLGKLPGLYKSMYELMQENQDVVEEMMEEEDEDEEDKNQKSIERLKQEEVVKKLFKATMVKVVRSVDAMALKQKQVLKKDRETREQQLLLRTQSEQEGEEGEEGEEREGESKSTTKEEEELTIEQVYRLHMKKYLFKMLDIKSSTHHYASSLASDKSAAKKRKKKLKKDLKQLKKDLPLEFGSSIFVRVDKTKPHLMQCMITGPGDTPYDSGCFQFDVYCPTTFPGGPPKVNLQTTGAGQVRFNPNLYNCGKVCLSLLGTWQGGAHGKENWDAKVSTLWQVFVSIQGQILGSTVRCKVVVCV